MKSCTLKPFDDKGYLSEEEALKLIEKIPIPKNDNGSGNPPEAKPDAHAAENPPKDDNPVVDLEGRLIDLNPADGESNKTQDQWVGYWNNITDGRVFASMPDYYLAFKHLKKEVEHGKEKICMIRKKVHETSERYSQKKKAA